MLFFERPITLEHVRQFCRDFCEGLRVEYKSNFEPPVRGKIAKVVSSFANSNGGVLVIGVDAVGGVPQPPFEGFQAPEHEELRLTVENLCLGGIYPPLLPENVTVVPSDVEGRVFLIIEVEESSAAPHAIENSQKVYVRTGDASNPYDLAKVDLILDLVRRRSDPLDLRNKLVGNARQRAEDPRNAGIPRMEVSICPNFPRAALCGSTDVWTLLQSTQPIRNPNMRTLLPDNSLRRVPDGAASVSQHVSANTLQYVEFNRYGLLYLSRPFGTRPWQNRQIQPVPLIFGDLLHALMRATTCAVRFYRQRFRGDILVAVSLLSVHNQVMRFRDPDPMFPDDDAPEEFTCHGGTVVANRIVSTEELAAGQSAFVTEVLIELTWAFWQGFGEHPTAALRRYVEQNI